MTKYIHDKQATTIDPDCADCSLNLIKNLNTKYNNKPIIKECNNISEFLFI
jgi:hypothetical protein